MRNKERLIKLEKLAAYKKPEAMNFVVEVVERNEQGEIVTVAKYDYFPQ